MDMLLEERDAPAKVVISFVAQIAAQKSHLLVEIFAKLDHDSAIVRRNALDLIAEVFKLNSQAADVALRHGLQ